MSEQPDCERRLRELAATLDATMPGNTHAQHIRACLAALDAARQKWVKSEAAFTQGQRNGSRCA